MYYCKVHDFVARKESVFLEDGSFITSDRIFINTRVNDFERYNDDTEISSTIIIVKGIDKDYLDLMTPGAECIGGLYKICSYDEEMCVFEIFVNGSDFNTVSGILKKTHNNTECYLQIYVNLHEYNDFNADTVLPITSLSLSTNEPDPPNILIGIAA